MTLECPACHATNRVPSIPTTRVRCGRCKHPFTPFELARAKPEPTPERKPYELTREEDGPACEAACRCGWEGSIDDLELDDQDRYRCPNCDKVVRVPNENPEAEREEP